MYTNRRFGAFSSSENPEELGSTVKAFILGIGVIVIYLVQLVFHVQWTPENINQFATEAGTLVTATWMAYGLVKKAVIWAIDKWNAGRVA